MTLDAPGFPFSLDPLIAEAKRRMRRRRLVVAAVVLAAVAAGTVLAAGGPVSSGPSGGGVLSGVGRAGSVRFDQAGAIGPLQMNRSSRAQVIAWAGEPNVDRVGRYVSAPRYEVLGYDCKPGAGTEKYWSSYVIACQTAFYVVDGKLSLFFTYDPRFREATGLGVGTPTKRAELLLHRKAIAGCTEAIGLPGKRTSLTVSVDSNRIRTVGSLNYVLGGHVDGFFLHGQRDPGVTDCD
jgi:hypothetical protein